MPHALAALPLRFREWIARRFSLTPALAFGAVAGLDRPGGSTHGDVFPHGIRH